MLGIYDEKGVSLVGKRKKIVLDCSKDQPLTEQAHVKEVNINNIIKKHGMDLIQKTSILQSKDFQFDDVTGNDFQEAMFKVTKAQETFDSMPSQIRKEFENSPAKFMDFVQNPDNIDRMVELGLAQRLPQEQPVEVVVTNPEPAPVTNPETPPE